MALLPYKSYPNEKIANNVASTGLASVDFGFPASQITVTNDGAGNAYYAFKSTEIALATTGGFQLSSGESFTLRDVGVAISGMSWAATSTAGITRYGAWG